MAERIDFDEETASVAEMGVGISRIREAMQRESDWKRKSLLLEVKERVLGLEERENCEEEMGFGVWGGLGCGWWTEEGRRTAMRVWR